MATLNELLRRLREPLPANKIKVKNTGEGGYQAEYVNVTDLKDLIDDRIGAGNWQSFLREMQVIHDNGLGQLIVIVEVKITGDDDKACTHIGNGWEVLEGVKYGDPCSNAYAMAMRRALESFGLGRELWRKEEDHSIKPGGFSGGNSDHRPGLKPRPSNPLAKSVSELATPKQIVMIRAICRELDLDLDLELQETMKLDCKAEELSRKAASTFIDHLKQLQEGDAVPIVRRSH